VYVPQKIQLERLMHRDNSRKEDAQSRIDAQMDIEEKKHKATYVISNEGNLKNLKNLCDKVKNKIIGDYKGK
jgi:dephospho-CoA kinase